MISSPDGARRAVVTVGSCGATTPYTGNVSIIAHDDEVPENNTGNTFRIRAIGYAESESAVSPVESVKLHWASADHLLIEYDRNSEVLLRDTLVAGVHVSFAPVTR